MKTWRQPGAAAQRPEPVPNPGVIVGDEVYCHHPKGPHAGRVAAHGKHGVTLADGRKVRWEHVLGHKRRAGQEYTVIDEGEDGCIVQDKAGRRQYVHVPPEARGEKMIVKSESGQRLALFMKADGAPYMGRAGLTKKQITDSRGVQTTRWVRATPEAGTPQVGHHVGWVNGEHRSHGEVSAVGKVGVTARDTKGGVHQVRHEHVTHRWDSHEKPESSPHKIEVMAHDGDPDTFSARSFAALHDDKEATAESIVSGFGGDAAARIQAARERLGGVKQTIEEHGDGQGGWNEQRAALHRKIIFDGVEVGGKKVPGLLHPDRIKAATPQPGQRPTFITLGGRGGSGKSSLNGRVYSEDRAIVLDADHIKGMLPEYGGWNAHQVHEESSHVLETVLAMAKILGVNVVLDATMKTGGSIDSKVDQFKQAGFRVEAHYMHLPRQEAAKRAVHRFLNGGEKGRFVPPEVVLGNTKNEENFDTIKAKADAWSFHDNSGEKGAGPKLIAQKGKPATVADKLVLKSEQPVIILLKGVQSG